MFVSFEGLDGSGKTTQVERLRASLEAEGREVVTAREPGGTALGEQLRALVLHGREMTPWAEALALRRRARRARRPGDRAGARARRRRAARPLLRQLRRLPGDRPRPRHRRGARAEPARGRAACVPDRTFVLAVDPATVARARRRQPGPDRARGRGLPREGRRRATSSSRRSSPSASSCSTARLAPERARGEDPG